MCRLTGVEVPGSLICDARGVSAAGAGRLAGAAFAVPRPEGRRYPVRNVHIYAYMPVGGTVMITKTFFLM